MLGMDWGGFDSVLKGLGVGLDLFRRGAGGGVGLTVF